MKRKSISSLFFALVRFLLRREFCEKNALGHIMEHGTWNSWVRSRYSGDYIGRRGNRCRCCGVIIWDQSSTDFYASIQNVAEQS